MRQESKWIYKKEKTRIGCPPPVVFTLAGPGLRWAVKISEGKIHYVLKWSPYVSSDFITEPQKVFPSSFFPFHHGRRVSTQECFWLATRRASHSRCRENDQDIWILQITDVITQSEHFIWWKKLTFENWCLVGNFRVNFWFESIYSKHKQFWSSSSSETTYTKLITLSVFLSNII